MERPTYRHHTPEPDPLDRLVRAFVERVMWDLRAGDPATLAYVVSDGLILDLRLMLPDADPAAVAHALMARWWRPLEPAG